MDQALHLCLCTTGQWVCLGVRLAQDTLYHYLQALSKNGKVYGNGIMVGVQPCIDKVGRLLVCCVSDQLCLSILPSVPVARTRALIFQQLMQTLQHKIYSCPFEYPYFFEQVSGKYFERC